MKSESMIKYDFRGRYKSTLNERIHVGFTTTDPKGFLLGLYSDISREFLTLMISNSGHIRLVFDFGFERQEMVFTEQNFMTGQYHDVLVERYNNGRNLRMTIDNYPPQEYDFSASLKTQAVGFAVEPLKIRNVFENYSEISYKKTQTKNLKFCLGPPSGCFQTVRTKV